MSKEEAWQECQDAFWTIHQDRCIVSLSKCGCKEFIEKVKGALYV